LQKLEQLEPNVVAIDMGSVASIDYTSLQVLRELPSTMAKVTVSERKRSLRRLYQLKEGKVTQSQQSQIDSIITTLEDFENMQVRGVHCFEIAN
jgi:hypothetical protein